ncbi:hypothetical protein ASZ90_019469 [hydrocarbon metagenome]|uniref:Uncharacterized protein n=1 Tax=hydrocarbon metagenome TaxID=938273 RepID=A0A0W8E3S7_9ZZZZ
MLNVIQIDGKKQIVKPQDIENMYQENTRLHAQLRYEQKTRERAELLLHQAKEQYAKLEKETRLHKKIFDLAEDAFINNRISTKDEGYTGMIAKLLSKKS